MTSVPIIAIVDVDASVRGAPLGAVESAGYRGKALGPRGTSSCGYLEGHEHPEPDGHRADEKRDP